jgi:hypothetical protein
VSAAKLPSKLNDVNGIALRFNDTTVLASALKVVRSFECGYHSIKKSQMSKIIMAVTSEIF